MGGARPVSGFPSYENANVRSPGPHAGKLLLSEKVASAVARPSTHARPPACPPPRGLASGFIWGCQSRALSLSLSVHTHTYTIITVKAGCAQKVGFSQVFQRGSSSWLNVRGDRLYLRDSGDNGSQSDQRLSGTGC